MRLEDLQGALEETLRTAAAELRRAEVPFMLGGSMACWARGAPLSRHDIDLYLKPADAERGLEALMRAGMRAEHPPEQWLVKAWNGDMLVDLIFEPIEGEVTDERIEAAEWMTVLGVWMHVASIEEVLVSRLLALSEQHLDLRGLVEIARALRERIDWEEVRARTDGSPFAAAYFLLLYGLGVIDGPSRKGCAHPTERPSAPDAHE